MKFYKHYPGDYIKKTGHLTLVQDAIYRRLLDHQYATEQRIASLDEAYLVTKASRKRDRKEVRFVLDKFFIRGQGGYTSPRFEKELEKYKSLVIRAKAGGNASAAKRATQRMVEPTVEQMVEPNDQLKPTYPRSQNQEVREVFKVVEAEESSTNTPQNGTAAAAAPDPLFPMAAPVSTEEIAEAFTALNTRPIGDYGFQLLFTVASRSFAGSWTDVMEGTILAAKNKGITVPREFFLIKREVEQIEVKNSFKQSPL